MRALEKSTGKTSAELEKMMEQGQLTTEYIKPLVMAMGELATANGAYEKALTKLGTVENRLKTSTQLASARIAEAGFTKGLINLYETLMKSMNENGETLERIGKIYEKVFNFLANVTQVATRFIEAFVRSLETIWDTIQWGLDNPIAKWLIMIPVLASAMTKFATLMSIAFRTPYMILGSILTVLDQIRAAFDADLIGWGENENASKEDRDLATAAFKVKMGVATAKEMSLVGMATPERIAQAQANAGGITGVFGALNPTLAAKNTMQYATNAVGFGGAATLMNTFGTNRDSIVNGLSNITGMRAGAITHFAATPFAWAKTGIDYAMGNEKQITVNQNITVQGNMSEDNVRQVKQAVESITSMETVSSR